MPRITIITPSYQQAAFLEECLTSVAGQEGCEVEHIVIDGGSTDGSAQLIAAHAPHLHHWESTPDRGQSHAINKGLAHATGEVFGWLNSDDALLPGALARVAEAFEQDPDLLVFGGRVVHRSDAGDRPFPRLNDAADTERLFRDPVVNQQATFLRMSAVKAIGGVEERLRYVMDYELWLQLLFRFGTDHLRFDPVDLAVFRLHPQSKTTTAHQGFLQEIGRVLMGLCEQVGEDELAGVLANGLGKGEVLRRIPAGSEHRGRVRGMVAHFLLKWFRTPPDRDRFRMMKAFAAIASKDPVMRAEHGERLAHLEEQVAVPDWNTYRIRRKWRHWTGR